MKRPGRSGARLGKRKSEDLGDLHSLRLRQFRLPLVERPEPLGLEFERAGDLQSVERTPAEFRPVTSGEVPMPDSLLPIAVAMFQETLDGVPDPVAENLLAAEGEAGPLNRIVRYLALDPLLQLLGLFLLDVLRHRC